MASNPSWDGCRLVRDRDRDYWSQDHGKPGGAYYQLNPEVGWPLRADVLEDKFGPCTPVLGPNGEPVITGRLANMPFTELATHLYIWSNDNDNGKEK